MVGVFFHKLFKVCRDTVSRCLHELYWDIFKWWACYVDVVVCSRFNNLKMPLKIDINDQNNLHLAVTGFLELSSLCFDKILINLVFSQFSLDSLVRIFRM